MAFALLALGVLAAGESPAPDFTLARPSGERVTLSALRGQAVLVVFWATWCPSCKRLLPGLEKLADFYGSDGLQVLAVDVWDQGDVREYLQSRGLGLEVLLEGDAVARQWGVRGTPTIFVLDAAGRVLLRTSTADADDPALIEAIERALLTAAGRKR